MPMTQQAESVEATVRRVFRESNVDVLALDTRVYPEETVIVVRVGRQAEALALAAARTADRELERGNHDAFVTVSAADSAPASRPARLTGGISDPRVRQLRDLLTSRSRISEAQPSLSYIAEGSHAVPAPDTPAHLLILGRRGAGKTALLVEGKRHVEARGHQTHWTNLQSHRHPLVEATYISICLALLDDVVRPLANSVREPALGAAVEELHGFLTTIRRANELSLAKVGPVVPAVQRVLQKLLSGCPSRLFIYLDDFHHVPRNSQPLLLDLLHGSVRDTQAWLRIAGIAHLCRPYDRQGPYGLQAGHDAKRIDLDLSLRDPALAKKFLERVLAAHTDYCHIRSSADVFVPDALDRLVLASGAVPRDYLNLCASSISIALQRPNARAVGVQDVNQAAGQAANAKLEELDDDAASLEQGTAAIRDAFHIVKEFCLGEKTWTAFRVSFADEETHPKEYSYLQELADLRLLHLLDPSVSDKRQAGQKAELYLLDLSQFVGDRLRGNLNVLDFQNGKLVLRHVRPRKADQVGDTPSRRQGLLRKAPQFPLERLAAVAARA